MSKSYLNQEEQQIRASMQQSQGLTQKVLELDRQRQRTLKEKQKREILDQAYKMVEARQKNIDEMMKHIHVVAKKPTFVSPSGAQRHASGVYGAPNQLMAMNNAGAGYGQYGLQPQPQRSSSLPHLMPGYQGQPLAQPYFDPNMPPQYQPQMMYPYNYGPYPQQYPVSMPSQFAPQLGPYQNHPPPLTPPKPDRLAPQEPTAQPQPAQPVISSQHARADVRNILDQNTLKTQEDQSRLLDLRRRQLIEAFKEYKSKEIQARENNQKGYYDGLTKQIQQISTKEQQLHDSLAFQQNLLYQMVQNVSESSQQAETQKEKNRKLYAQIKSFERKNKDMKDKINQALLLSLGNKVLDGQEHTPAEQADIDDLKLQLKALIQNKKMQNLKHPELLESDDGSGSDEY